jgi:hypothetical protein
MIGFTITFVWFSKVGDESDQFKIEQADGRVFKAEVENGISFRELPL